MEVGVKSFYNLCRLGVRHISRRSSSRLKSSSSDFTRNVHRGRITSAHIYPKPATDACSIVKTFPTSHQSLSIGFQDHLESDFQYIWLRDNCPCSKCVHPENRQKTLDTVSLDINIKPKSYRLTENGQLLIVWPENDGKEHVSTYDSNWLHKYGKGFELEKSVHDELPPMVTWNREKIGNIKPEISYEEVMHTEQGVRDWLEMLYKYGVAIMRGVPCKKDEVINVVERFAYIKKTKWGTSFDVLCEPVQTDPKHLAFSGMYLEHHTDMNYLEKSPGLQALHCLKANAVSEGDDIGGQSFFVDGFYIAKWLRKYHPSSFHALTSTTVKFKIYSHKMEYSNAQNVICANRTGDIQEVHYNTRTMAPLEGPPDAVQPFYEAYKLFGQKMREPESEFKFNLVPGDLVAFNNRRILHGRTQFDPTKVYRHLQGCYGDIDEVITRYKTSIKEPLIRNG